MYIDCQLSAVCSIGTITSAYSFLANNKFIFYTDILKRWNNYFNVMFTVLKQYMFML